MYIKLLIGQDVSLVWLANKSGLKAIFAVLIGLVIFGFIFTATGGLATLGSVIAAEMGKLAAATKIAGVVCTALGGIYAGHYIGVQFYNNAGWGDDGAPIPFYSISPEEIFKGEIPLFNVNFFEDPKGRTYERKYSELNYYDEDVSLAEVYIVEGLSEKIGAITKSDEVVYDSLKSYILQFYKSFYGKTYNDDTYNLDDINFHEVDRDSVLSEYKQLIGKYDAGGSIWIDSYDGNINPDRRSRI